MTVTRKYFLYCDPVHMGRVMAKSSGSADRDFGQVVFLFCFSSFSENEEIIYLPLRVSVRVKLLYIKCFKTCLTRRCLIVKCLLFSITETGSTEQTYHCYSLFFLLKTLFISRERGREGEREKNINRLPLMCPLLGTWPITQARALAGN